MRIHQILPLYLILTHSAGEKKLIMDLDQIAKKGKQFKR